MTDTTAGDPVLAAVIDNRLHSIATQMAETMLRTSRSAIFQARDFVTGIFTGDGQWVATKDYIPVLAGSLPYAYEGIVERFGGEVEEGDVYILNDPYHGNNHPPDITVAKPVFHEGVLRFWSVTKGHNADVGGGGLMGYNPYARNCYEDALRIPPVRLYHRGVYQRDVWDLILLNLPLRELVEGDLSCQVGAATVGERELIAVLDKFGPDVVAAAIDHQLAASQRHMEAEIEKLADGVYRSVRFIDKGGAHHQDPIAVRLTATIEGAAITLDFSDSDPQVEGYANSSIANTAASALIGVFGVVDPNLRRNSGSSAPIRLVTKPGTVAHAVEPAATTLNTLTNCEATVEAIWEVLAEAAPELSNAAWSRAWAFATAGIHPRTGRPFVGFAAPWGGSGATHGYDGWPGIGTPVTMGGARGLDVEESGSNAPFVIRESGFSTDSGGVGTWRGGLGGQIVWQAAADGLQVVNYGSGGLVDTAPFGIAGGAPAQPNSVVLRRADGTEEEFPMQSILTLDAGDTLVLSSSGGGGYGNPLERELEAIRLDLRDGHISAEAAERDYGVVIDPATGALDPAASARRREQLGAPSADAAA